MDQRRQRCRRCDRVIGRDNPHLPFCSERCRLLDLGRWIDGTFRVAGEKVSKTEGEGDR